MTTDDDYPLFVYGLLRRGMSAGLEAFVGAGAAAFLSEATLSGKLYDMGEYPGVLLEDGPSVVHGELWRVRGASAWATLDEFEGIGPGYGEPTLYKRVLANALAPPSEAPTSRSAVAETPVKCWVYVYNHDLAGAALIESGDWARR